MVCVASLTGGKGHRNDRSREEGEGLEIEARFVYFQCQVIDPKFDPWTEVSSFSFFLSLLACVS